MSYAPGDKVIVRPSKSPLFMGASVVDTFAGMDAMVIEVIEPSTGWRRYAVRFADGTVFRYADETDLAPGE